MLTVLEATLFSILARRRTSQLFASSAVCTRRLASSLVPFILEGWCRIQAIEWADAALSMDGKAPKARNLMAEMPRCTFALGDKAEAEM